MESVRPGGWGGWLRCGVPLRATLMKLAVNVYLIGSIASLAESWHHAESLGLDLDVFAGALVSGQLSSPRASRPRMRPGTPPGVRRRST